MNRRIIAAALGFVLIGGCAVTPTYVQPTPATPEQWSVPIPGTGSAADANLSQWWKQFNDPVLAKLVERALKDNRDVRIATARIAEARALQRQADARLRPNVSASGSVARDRASENNRFPLRDIPNPVDLYQAGFDASWEMDLFGGLQSARGAAAAETQRVIFDREALAVSTSAEVAVAYLHLRGAQARITSLDEQILVARDTIQLVESRVRAGLVSELDRVRAHETLSSLEARRPPLRATADVETRRLGVLVGMQADALVRELAPRGVLPDVVPKLPATVPAQLLAQRADLRSIERALAAEYARIGIAEADRYPRLALGLSLGLLSLSTGTLASPASALWNAGANFTAPIYDGGARRAQVALAQARYEQAAIRYEQAAATAAEEVESGALRYQYERERREKLVAVVRANEDARNLALVRYQGGLGDFLAVLDAQRQLFNAQDDELSSREQSLSHLVSLYKALGGGFCPNQCDKILSVQ